ncbi:hypothetical protein ABW19_dt0205340 [Dactylella cylindrospora]|nr:hypothetical protein ABW19_dt0205340 [Dactylella cylindrospora]
MGDRSIQIVIFTLGLFSAHAFASSCDANPLVLPFGSVQLETRVEGVAKVEGFGIPMKLGGQDVAMVIAADYSYTDILTLPGVSRCVFNAVNNTVECDDSIYSSSDGENNVTIEEYTAIASFGGLYDNLASTTYMGPFFLNAENSTESRAAEDTLGVGSLTLSNYSFYAASTLAQRYPLLEVAVSPPILQNWIGLKSNSSFLHRLFDMGDVPSKVWSFFAGWNGPGADEVHPGTLVIGGSHQLDSSLTLPISERNCSLQVLVTAITVNIGGNLSSLNTWESGAGLPACVDTSYDALLLPDGVYENLLEAANIDFSDVLNINAFYPNDTYEPDFRAPVSIHGIDIPRQTEEFNFTIHIHGNETSDIAVNIPSHQILQPVKSIAGTQYIYRTDLDRSFLKVHNGTTGIIGYPRTYLPVLGLPFLSSAYLTVNHDNSSFSITPISHPSVVAAAPVIRIGGGSCDNSKTTIIIGASVGGGVLILIVISTIAFFWMRRRRASKVVVVAVGKGTMASAKLKADCDQP